MDEPDNTQPELKKFEGGLPYMFVGTRVTPRRQRVIPRVFTVVIVAIIIALLIGVLFAVVNLFQLSRIRFSDEDIPPAETVPATSAGADPAPVPAVDLQGAGSGGRVQIRAAGPR